jgi:uncharacterized protein (TIGR02452 family)
MSKLHMLPCLANGVQPGGGFLGGARAQEEVLCRSSALWHTLIGDPMYEDSMGCYGLGNLFPGCSRLSKR